MALLTLSSRDNFLTGRKVRFIFNMSEIAEETPKLKVKKMSPGT